ncbi:hypothetical protein [Jatrophihabitans sp.]|uniref:hypothetical protein n=1 Tax=Jatrophihabitans sp. TaxID=1932789 RepID=UPI002BB3F98C|nr:hypothetical protein [Jatrophihabitans sp.]
MESYSSIEGRLMKVGLTVMSGNYTVIACSTDLETHVDVVSQGLLERIENPRPLSAAALLIEIALFPLPTLIGVSLLPPPCENQARAA